VQKNRGKWSSLDGVTIFGWSGSAMLGGLLLDRCAASLPLSCSDSSCSVRTIVLA
jgi:hypothetical protein